MDAETSEGCDDLHFRAAGKEFPWCAFRAGSTRCVNRDRCVNPRHAGRQPPPQPKPDPRPPQPEHPRPTPGPVPGLTTRRAGRILGA